MTNKGEKLQDKVKGIYYRIGSEFYLNRSDFEVSGKEYNSSLLFGILTELNKGNQLLFGEYGGGKTTSAEYLNSVFNSLPLDLVKQVSLRGSPQLTEEKMVGRPDYGKMHQGQEDVVWQNFVLVGPKIFDEFNRIPESNQSVVLNGVDRGDWNYLNGNISNGPQPFFATANYSDKGNNKLIPPILDRFDVALESKFPGTMNALSIAMDYNNKKDKILKNPEVTREALKILNSGKNYEEVKKDLEGLVSQHSDKLVREGFPVLSDEEKRQVEEEISSMPLSQDAAGYFAFLNSELNSSPKYGQKRSSDDPEGNKENGLYLNVAFAGSGSRREDKSLIRYAQSLAWLHEEKEVNLDHISQVAPYVLWHRIDWTEETIHNFSKDDREDPLGLHVTKKLVNEGDEEMPGVKSRFKEQEENYQRVMGLVRNGDDSSAREEAERFYRNGKGHPLFGEVLKDLGGR